MLGEELCDRELWGGLLGFFPLCFRVDFISLHLWWNFLSYTANMLMTSCVPHSPWPTDWLPTCTSALPHHHHNYADVQDHCLPCSCWGSGTSPVWQVLPWQFPWGLALTGPGQILASRFVISKAKSLCILLWALGNQPHDSIITF